MADDIKKTVYSYNWGSWCRIKFTRRSILETFLFVKFVDLLEKNCVSYPEHSFPFPYDGRYSSNVKRSLRWSAWLSWINQRLEWTIGILKFFCFHHARKSKQTGKKNAAHTHNANADVGRLNHTLHYLFHHSPWFSPCFRRFFFKLLLSFNGFLFSFSLIVFFCLGFLRPFNYFWCEVQMFFICVSRYPFWCASVLCRIYCFLQIGDRRFIIAKIPSIHDFIRSSHIWFSYSHSHLFTTSWVIWN